MSDFRLYPAIDLVGGEVVRLTEGDFSTKKAYHSDPVAVAQGFFEKGATHLHIVDLDGAKLGKPQQTAVIKQIMKESSLAIQVGGGVRCVAHVLELIEAGAERIIIGSLAVREPAVFRQIVSEVGAAKVTLGLDVRMVGREAKIAVSGWQQMSSLSAFDFLRQLQDLAIDEMQVLCTDISRDGKLAGLSVGLYKRLLAEFPGLKLLASGGVRNARDIREVQDLGMAGVIVGKAIYEAGLDIGEVITACQSQA